MTSDQVKNNCIFYRCATVFAGIGVGMIMAGTLPWHTKLILAVGGSVVLHFLSKEHEHWVDYRAVDNVIRRNHLE